MHSYGCGSAAVDQALRLHSGGEQSRYPCGANAVIEAGKCLGEQRLGTRPRREAGDGYLSLDLLPLPIGRERIAGDQDKLSRRQVGLQLNQEVRALGFVTGEEGVLLALERGGDCADRPGSVRSAVSAWLG